MHSLIISTVTASCPELVSDSGWADRFFDAGLVALGGSISIISAFFFERWRNKRNEEETASEIVRKFFTAYNSILGIKKQIDDFVANANNPPRDQLWAAVVQLIGGEDPPITLDGKELSLLHRAEAPELFNALSEVFRAHRILESSVAKYAILRENLQIAAAPLSEFNLLPDGRHFGSIEFDRREHPILYSQILDCNSLIVSIYDLLERQENNLSKTKDLLNSTIAKNKKIWGKVPSIGVQPTDQE